MSLFLQKIPHHPTLYFVLRTLQLVYLNCLTWSIWLLAPPSTSNLLSSFGLLCIFSFCTLPISSCIWSLSYSLFPPSSLGVLQRNVGGFRSRTTNLLLFILSPPVILICIQETNLNSSSSFRIPGLSVLRFDRTHSRSSTLSPDATHASGVVIIFVR